MNASFVDRLVEELETFTNLCPTANNFPTNLFDPCQMSLRCEYS
jgi:hypothetical protein